MNEAHYTVEIIVRDMTDGEPVEETVLCHGLELEEALDLAERIEEWEEENG